MIMDQKYIIKVNSVGNKIMYIKSLLNILSTSECNKFYFSQTKDIKYKKWKNV